MDAIYRASAEVLIAATRLGSDRDLPPPGIVRQELLRMLHQMVLRCRQAGIADKDTAEARYAIVAFIDERILRSNWAGRIEWMNKPLQLELYDEFAAGENFFARMRSLLATEPESNALEVYYLCLALGFVGAAGAAQQAQSLVEHTRKRLPRVAAGTPLSPHAIPTDNYSATQPRRPLVLALALSCVLVVGLGMGLLRWSLDSKLEKTQHDLAASRAARIDIANER